MTEYHYLINGKAYKVSVFDRDDEGLTTVNVNGVDYTVGLAPEPQAPERPHIVPAAPKPQAAKEKDPLQDALRAPLPGTVIETPVSPGDNVKEGDTLIVLEAMKMDNRLTAERDAIVSEVLVRPGEAVKENTPLVTFQ